MSTLDDEMQLMTVDAAAVSKANEQAVLGAILHRPDLLDRMPWLHAEDFFRPVHADLFATLTEMRDQQVPIDPVTTMAAMRATGRLKLNPAERINYLHTLYATVPLPASGVLYARGVLEQSIHRELVAAGVRIRQVALESTDIAASLAAAREQLQVIEDADERWQAAQREVDPARPRPLDEHQAEAARAMVETLGWSPAEVAQALHLPVASVEAAVDTDAIPDAVAADPVALAEWSAGREHPVPEPRLRVVNEGIEL